MNHNPFNKLKKSKDQIDGVNCSNGYICLYIQYHLNPFRFYPSRNT